MYVVETIDLNLDFAGQVFDVRSLVGNSPFVHKNSYNKWRLPITYLHKKMYFFKKNLTETSDLIVLYYENNSSLLKKKAWWIAVLMN